MRTVHVYRRLTSWIAALAIVLAALVPTMGYAFASASGISLVEICTTQGSKWVQANDEAGSEPAPASINALDHCPYCTLHTSVPGVPPVDYLAQLPLRLSHEVPRAYLAAQRTLHAWVSAQPRAPPLFS